MIDGLVLRRANPRPQLSWTDLAVLWAVSRPGTTNSTAAAALRRILTPFSNSVIRARAWARAADSR
jgi:hypothetical protein